MKNTLFVFILLVPICSLLSCSILTIKEKEFNFILKWGQDRNRINTFNNMITKDLINDDTTLSFTLPKKSKDSILAIVEKIDLFDYPDVFEPIPKDSIQYHQSMSAIPPEYYIKIMLNDERKEVSWIDRENSQSEQAVALRTALGNIIGIIYNTRQYRRLSNPR